MSVEVSTWGIQQRGSVADFCWFMEHITMFTWCSIHFLYPLIISWKPSHENHPLIIQENHPVDWPRNLQPVGFPGWLMDDFHGFKSRKTMTLGCLWLSNFSKLWGGFGSLGSWWHDRFKVLSKWQIFHSYCYGIISPKQYISWVMDIGMEKYKFFSKC